MSTLLQEYISALSGGNYTHKNTHLDILNNSYVDFILQPRPPAIGEEKEFDCSVSEKSAKSHTTAGKQTSSSNGDSNSACLTPRKSKLPSAMNHESSSSTKEIIAPLGFEPEGCSSKRDNFNETNQTACDVQLIPALKWAVSLKNLLNDGEGVRLFRQFLAQEGSSNILDFWFACQGLKLVPNDDTFMLTSLVRLIYRKYIRKEALGLRNNTKRKIVEELRSNVIDSRTFEKAQGDIFESMQQDSYPLFLKSNLYLEYVRLSLERSQKSTGNSSGSNESSGSDPTAKSFLNPMPTLHENDTLSSKFLDKSYFSGKISNASLMSSMNAPVRKNMKDDWPSFHNLNSMKGNNANMYHLSHAPMPSCLDSEIQSLSSDAHTDGYMSQNENIFQVERIHKHAPAKKMKRINSNISNVHGLQAHNNLRPNRAMGERDLAEKNPARFAEILIGKLQKVQEEETFLNKIKSAVLLPNSNSHNYLESTPIKSQLISQFQTHPLQQRPSSQAHNPLQQQQQPYSDTGADDAAAQNILEQHVSRIWNDEDTAMEHTFFLKSGAPHRTRRTPQSMQALYNAKLYSDEETSSLANYASMNCLNREYYDNKESVNYERPSNYDGHLAMGQQLFHNSVNYNSNAWPIYYVPNDSKNAEYFKNIYEASQFLSQSNASMYQSESKLKAESMVDLGRVKGHKRESSRSDTEAGWGASTNLMPPQQRHFSYLPHHSNRQPFSNLFDSYLGNHVVPATRFVSLPPANSQNEKTVIGYYFCDEVVPYRTTMIGINITLGQFKNHISKKGNYRYFFKKASDEFGSGVVNEEIFNNNDILPLWEGKIFGKIEKIIL